MRTRLRLPALLASLVAGVLLAAPSALAQTDLGLEVTDALSLTGLTPEPHVRIAWTSTGQTGEIYQIRRARYDGALPGPEQILAEVPQSGTEYLDSSALPGIQYRYAVEALVAGVTEEADGSRALRRPVSLTASDSTRVDGVVLTWTDLSSVEAGYVVYRAAPGTYTPDANTAIAATGLVAVDTTTADATGYLDASADTLETYQYCVGLLDGSVPTPAVSGPLACEVGTRGALRPPAQVVASDGTIADRVRVAWATRRNVTYTVRRADGGSFLVLATELEGPTYDDATAAESTPYTYCVSATVAADPDAGTEAVESVPVCDTGRRGDLKAPTRLAASDATSDSAVDLTWTDPGPDETGIRIYRTPDGGDEELIATLPADRVRYSDRTAEIEVAYSYCVAAIAEATVDGAVVIAESVRSCDDGERAALLAPEAFTATTPDDGDEAFVELAWESESDVVQLFRVFRNDGEGEAVIATLPPFARSYRDATGLSGAAYDYRVEARAIVGFDPDQITQGLSPIFGRATAERAALAAQRSDAETTADRARVDAQTAAVERDLSASVDAFLADLGVSASGTEVRTATTPTATGSRRLLAPTGLTAGTDLEDRVVVSWTDRSGIETDYWVRALYSETDSVDVLVGPNRTEWIDLVGPAGVDGTYRVRAIDRDTTGGVVSASAWATATGRRDLFPPGALAVAQTPAETELLVTWRDSSRAETGYRVEAALDAGAWTSGALDTNARRVTIPITPADFGRSIALTVRAVAPVDAAPNVASESEAATASYVPTLLPPLVVTASTGYTNQVVLAWTDDSDANDGYTVTVSTGGSALQFDDITTTTFADVTGAATYCVAPTRSGSASAQPPPVCATGRVTTVTPANTGDVVTTLVAAVGLDFVEPGVGGGAGFGSAVAADGGEAVVGAPADALDITRGTAPDWSIPRLEEFRTGVLMGANGGGYRDTGLRGNVGAASLFARKAGGWGEAERIQIAPDSRFTYGKFGWDVDVRGDLAIVGAPGEATYYNHFNHSTLAPADPNEIRYRTDVTLGDGAAYLYRRSPDGEWARLGMIRALGLGRNDFTTEELNNSTGFPRAMDGGVDEWRRIAFEYRSLPAPFGSAWVSTRAETFDLDLAALRMGELVALADDWAFSSFVHAERPGGSVNVVGQYSLDPGFAYQRFLDGPPNFDSASGSLAADGDLLVIGSSVGNQVDVRELAAGSGVPSAPFEITAPGDIPGGTGAAFGRSVDVRGDLVVVGAPGGNVAYVYRRAATGFSWGLEARLEPEAGDLGFGQAVSIADGFVTVSTHGGPESVVYTFRRQDGAWVQGSRLTVDPAVGPGAEGFFGWDVATTDDDLVIGSPSTTTSDGLTGAVHFATVTVTPSGVEASDGRYASRVQVRWGDQAVAEDGYRIYRRGPGDLDHVLVGTVGPDLEVFDDFDIAPGAAYSYCVASYLGEDETDTNPLGESGRICDVGYTPPNGTISGQLATAEGAAVIGVPVCLAPGPDQAVMFDGIQGRAVAPLFGGLPEAFTLEAWVYTDDTSAGDVTQPVAGIDGDATAMLLLDAGRPRILVRNGGGVTAASMTGAALTPGWHHLTATHDGSQLALFVDGERVAGAASPPAGPAIATGAFQIAGDAAGNRFDGRIDEVRLWARALTADEVAASFAEARPLAGDEVDLAAYWPLDQGSGRVLTDLSPGARHATLQGGAEWTGEAAPLATCAVSDGDGNYTFDGIRYGESTAFRVSPSDPTRQFSPGARTATLTPASPTENQVDFTDASTYTVRGRVVHAVDPVWTGQAPPPAAEVEIYVDDELAGTSESDGTFAVAVRGAADRPRTFEARAEGLAFTAAFSGTDFDDGSAEIMTEGDFEGLVFTNTVQHTLRGRAAGGCDRLIGDVTFRIYTADGTFDQSFTTDGGAAYELPLPPLAYRLEYQSIADVPDTLDRLAVQEYFRNLGVLRADLTEAEADTVGFQYRAPIRLAILQGDRPFSETAGTCGTYTITDADGNPRQAIPEVPVIGEYERPALTIRAFEDYGDGNECAVDVGTVRIFDGFADATDSPVELELNEAGEARYTSFGRSPDTFSGRTVGGIDRSYQKSLTAVLEVPDGPTVTETVWAVVEGFREKPATFVTGTFSEIPLMILRDPPGTHSSAFVEEGTSSCMTVSNVHYDNLAFGLDTEVIWGGKTEVGLIVSVEVGAGLRITGSFRDGVETGNSTGADNYQICATATDRWETSSDAGWSSDDVYAGVGLNVIYAEADVVTADEAACRVDLSSALASGIDEEDPFATTFTYTESHIRDTLIPRLEGLAQLAGEDTELEDSDSGAAVTLRRAITNWEDMLVFNDSLVTEALDANATNESYSAGASYTHGVSADTTYTDFYTRRGYTVLNGGIGAIVTVGGYDSVIEAVVESEEQRVFSRESDESTSNTVGYTLSDGDAGDYFSVDVARDPRYGTYVFNTLSGASSNPWEPNTQKRDRPRLEIAEPVLAPVAEGTAAVLTLTLANASESDEAREYVIDAPPHLNPDGAIIKVNGHVLEGKRYFLEDDQAISIPVTVERGPAADDYDLTFVAYAEADLHGVATDTARVEVSFVPTVRPVRLVAPDPGWAITIAEPTLGLRLEDIDLSVGDLTARRVGVEVRRRDEAWQEISEASKVLNELDPENPDYSATWTPAAGAFADGVYELRAYARSTEADGALPPYLGPIRTGVIDRTAPVPFGPPEPADVVLALGETIGITFEEPIGCDALRAAIDGGATIAELVPQAGTPPVLQIGCAERTVLLAPQDPSAWTALEGQLVTARLRGVTDLAGNPMGSATEAAGTWDQEWTFTVRRNGFGWTPAVVTARAQPDVPTELAAALVNGRAQPVTYDLQPNNPAFDPDDTAETTRPFVFEGDGGASVYLTAAGYSGTVVAGDVQPVVFRWPGAPVGTYTSTIDVRSWENGEDLGTSPLDLTVEVTCEAPAWAVNAAAFETGMSVMAELRMAGSASTDPADLLAAFVDGEVRGVAAVEEMSASGETLGRVPLTIYGTGAAERVVFQAWDDSECTLHPTTSQVIEFAPATVLGTVESPLVVEAPGDGGAPLEVPLAAGWTRVSTNRTGTSPLASALVGVGASENDVIQSQTGFSQYSPGTGWVGAVSGMDPGRGYNIRLDAPATMTHPGAPVDPTTPLGLLAGWNWIGFLPTAPLPLDVALESVTFTQDDVIKSQTAYAQYVEGVGWLGSLRELAPGIGYQLRVVDDATLTYPAPAAGARAPGALAVAPRPVRRMDVLPRIARSDVAEWPVILPTGGGHDDPPPAVAAAGPAAALAADAASAAQAFEHSMIVTATVADPQEDLLVAAYDADGSVRGVAPVEAVDGLDGARVFLLVFGRSGEPLTLRPVVESEAGDLVPVGELSLPGGLPGTDEPSTDPTLAFERDAIYGTAADPLVVELSGATALDDDLPTEVALAPTRPNPTSGAATFAFALPEATAVRLVVYDVLGRQVAVLADGDRPAGRHEVRLGGRALASGTYVARLTAGPEVRARTFTVAR